MLLVLSRRIGEEIVNHNTTRVVVLGVQGSRIRLGISAPPHIAIQRREVRERDVLSHSIGESKYVGGTLGNPPALV